MRDPQEMYDSFAKQTMMTTLGASVVSVKEGEVVLSAPITEHVLQHHGFAHAAVAFALGDTAAGYSAATLMEPGSEPLTAELKINFLAPARGDRLEATGHVVKAGRRMIVVGATVAAIHGDTRRDIAVLQGTMVAG